jgi:beta-lactamase class D
MKIIANSACLSLVLGLILALTTAGETRAGETGPRWQSSPEKLADGQKVCMSVFSETSQSWLIYNLPQCQMPLSPCSTFKIPNALLGLEFGVLNGPQHGMSWDGTEYDRAVLNQDHDLASAMQNSVVWYFQEVARQIGAQRMQQSLDALDYGNRDISGGIDRFWLGDSLLVSALEQVAFLEKLVNSELPQDPVNQQTVLQLLQQDIALPDDFPGVLYGKTGSCPMPGDDHGWFVGMHEREDDRLVFAVNIIGKTAWGPDARRLAIRMLQAIE